MTRRDYRTQLHELREDVLAMSDLVCQRLELGLRALDEGDPALAERVIEGDAEVNDLYLQLEDDCIDLLALQQPVAGDLRLIAATFKILTDLERIADLATNLGRYARRTEREVHPDVDVRAIGDRVLSMVEEAMTAYALRDGDACYEIATRDDGIDERCAAASERVVRELVESETEPRELEPVVQDVSRVLLTLRDLERIGDHAVNVAARTLYMVENDDELIY